MKETTKKVIEKKVEMNNSDYKKNKMAEEEAEADLWEEQKNGGGGW